MKIVEPQKHNPSIKVMGKERLKKDSDGLREPPGTAGACTDVYDDGLACDRAWSTPASTDEDEIMYRSCCLLATWM